MDTDQDGFLSFEDFSRAHFDEKLAREDFDDIDMDNDGLISFDEFAEFSLMCFGWLMNPDCFYRCLWVSLDRDKDDCVSYDEFTRFYHRKNSFFEKYAKMDSKRGAIDQESLGHYSTKSDQEILNIFVEIDANKDGKISYDGNICNIF